MTTLDRRALDEVRRHLDHEVEVGHLGACQLAIGLHGEVVERFAAGGASDTSRFAIFSATKVLTAMAVLPHLDDGTLDLTTPVAHYLPEFGHHGKDEVTVLQLLTMQGGFPQEAIGPDRWGTSAGRRAQFAEWRLAWPAGSRTEYHPVSAHWVIAELLEALNARPYIDVIHERVVAPAGVGRLLGPEVSVPHVVRVVGAYPDGPDAADQLAATFGRPDLVPLASIGVDALLTVNIRAVQEAAVPGGGAIASADDMALVYQQFLHNRSGALPDRWLADALGTVRNASVSVSDKVPSNRTVAGYIAGNDGFHLHRWMPDLPQAFGHAGAGGQLCWVDPDSGVSCAFLHDMLHQDPRVDFHRAAELHHLLVRAIRP